MANVLGFTFLAGIYVLLFLMGYYKAKGIDSSFMTFAFIGIVLFLAVEGLAVVFHVGDEE